MVAGNAWRCTNCQLLVDGATTPLKDQNLYRNTPPIERERERLRA